MKHVVSGAYKDALRHLRMSMSNRMHGTHDPEDPEEEAGENPAEEAAESPAEELKEEGQEGEQDPVGMSLDEKRERMYGKKRAPKKDGTMLVIGLGKKPGGSMPGKGKYK